jgi:hypothetical protein
MASYKDAKVVSCKKIKELLPTVKIELDNGNSIFVESDSVGKLNWYVEKTQKN